MTPRIPPRIRHAAAVWTARCRTHSDLDIGVHVFSCGIGRPRRPSCPCEIGDRYLVVNAIRADLRWQCCADVLVCAEQSDQFAARWVAGDALARLPGCTLTVASFCASACVLRIRRETVLMSGHPLDPALFAAFAYLRQIPVDAL
jgi:hypothetical protein